MVLGGILLADFLAHERRHLKLFFIEFHGRRLRAAPYT
jgi:hypothetical protein